MSLKTGWWPGFALLVVVLSPSRAAAVDCASCHDQGQKLETSAHTGLPCQSCHESHEQYPHPVGTAKPVCANCHRGQAGDYANGAHGQARKNGNEGAPDCALTFLKPFPVFSKSNSGSLYLTRETRISIRSSG